MTSPRTSRRNLGKPNTFCTLLQQSKMTRAGGGCCCRKFDERDKLTLWSLYRFLEEINPNGRIPAIIDRDRNDANVRVDVALPSALRALANSHLVRSDNRSGRPGPSFSTFPSSVILNISSTSRTNKKRTTWSVPLFLPFPPLSRHFLRSRQLTLSPTDHLDLLPTRWSRTHARTSEPFPRSVGEAPLRCEEVH